MGILVPDPISAKGGKEEEEEEEEDHDDTITMNDLPDDSIIADLLEHGFDSQVDIEGALFDISTSQTPSFETIREQLGTTPRQTRTRGVYDAALIRLVAAVPLLHPSTTLAASDEYLNIFRSIGAKLPATTRAVIHDATKQYAHVTLQYVACPNLDWVHSDPGIEAAAHLARCPNCKASLWDTSRHDTRRPRKIFYANSLIEILNAILDCDQWAEQLLYPWAKASNQVFSVL